MATTTNSVFYVGPKVWPGVWRNMKSIDLFEVFDSNSYPLGYAILTESAQYGYELWEAYCIGGIPEQQTYIKVGGLNHLSTAPDQMLIARYTTIGGWPGIQVLGPPVSPPGLLLPATITALYQGNAQLTGGFNPANLDFALHYYCSGYKWDDIVVVRRIGDNKIWVYEADATGTPNLKSPAIGVICKDIDDCLNQLGINGSFGTPNSYPTPVIGPGPKLPSPPSISHLSNPFANISSPFFTLPAANSKLPGIKVVEQYHIPKPASGPARCTSCNEPNEYQDGPFLCTQCKMRQTHWT